MVPHFIHELSPHYYGVFALGFEPGSNSKALLLRMRQACFRKRKLQVWQKDRRYRRTDSIPLFHKDCHIRNALSLNTSCLLGSSVKILKRRNKPTSLRILN